MLKKFQTHIKKQFPILLQKSFLLACSGGVDSVVLAHLCSKANLDFALAHCNFNLRGEESDGDEKLVRTLGSQLHKTCHVIQFDTKKYIVENKLSLQEGARKLRYDWFHKLMSQNDYEVVLTAHHADDDVETFLINLSRGTGIDGLTGIPSQNGKVIRPLLEFSQQEILNYANSEGIQWREDSSNANTKYVRNKIRHQITPVLKELHPTFLENFKKTQHYLAQTSGIIETHIQNLKTQIFKEKEGVIKIEISKLKELNPIEGYMHALFNMYGFTEWSNINALLSSSSGKEVVSKTHRLLKDRSYLLLQEIVSKGCSKYSIKEGEHLMEPFHMDIETVNVVEDLSKKSIYIDKETLKFPLELRKWKKGDYFYPFGMDGKKKLSKFFKDEKIDQFSKEKQWFLCSEDQIVWIVGKRADNRFRVTNSTTTILKFTLK